MNCSSAWRLRNVGAALLILPLGLGALVTATDARAAAMPDSCSLVDEEGNTIGGGPTNGDDIIVCKHIDTMETLDTLAGDDEITIDGVISGTIHLGPGNDSIDVDGVVARYGSIYGGEGDDTMIFVSKKMGANEGIIHGNGGDDEIKVQSVAPPDLPIMGGEGNESTGKIYGGSGDDTIEAIGSDGASLGGAGNRGNILGGEGNDVITLKAGDGTKLCVAANEGYIKGEAGDDTFNATGGAPCHVGNAANHSIEGNEGNDTFNVENNKGKLKQ